MTEGLGTLNNSPVTILTTLCAQESSLIKIIKSKEEMMNCDKSHDLTNVMNCLRMNCTYGALRLFHNAPGANHDTSVNS